MLAVKAYDLAQVVQDIQHLLGPKTMVMTVQTLTFRGGIFRKSAAVLMVGV